MSIARVVCLCLIALAVVPASPVRAQNEFSIEVTDVTCGICYETWFAEEQQDGSFSVAFEHTFHPECGFGQDVVRQAVAEGRGVFSSDQRADCPIESVEASSVRDCEGGDSNDVTCHTGVRSGSCIGGHGSGTGGCEEMRQIYNDLIAAIESGQSAAVKQLVERHESLTAVEGHLELVSCGREFVLGIGIPANITLG